MRNCASGNDEGWIASSRSLSSGRPKAGPVGPRNDSKRDILSPQPRRQPLTDLAACDLKTIYPYPAPRVIAQARPEIDARANAFIEMLPSCVPATSASDGSVDASPPGGNPGFVCVAGPNQLVLPDCSGNNRIDSL